MDRPTPDYSVPKKGFQLCPVCGCRYQRSLADHLDKEIPGSGGISRCDWRLNEQRILYQVTKLRDAGWRLAGNPGARVASQLSAQGYRHLAKQTTSGSLGTKVHKMFIDPANDLKAWWVKRWVWPLTLINRWSLRTRAQVVVELDGRDEAQEAVEAAFLVGGLDAVAGLEGTPVIAKRCAAVYGDPRDAMMGILRTVNPRTFDRCMLAAGHGEDVAHVGAKTGLIWSKTWVTMPMDAQEDADLDDEW